MFWAIGIGQEDVVADRIAGAHASALPCPYEHEVVAAVLSRRWATAPDDLKQHAADCEMCRDVVTVVGVLSADQERARDEARVPAAGQIWWRAAVRARLEAAQTAVRPLTWLHGIAGACAVGLVCALIGMLWPSVREMTSWFTSQTLGVDPGIADVATLVTAAMQHSLPLAFVVAACIVLAPVALYFVLTED
jgi:hypothetical protein